jgi:hypothetical protein
MNIFKRLFFTCVTKSIQPKNRNKAAVESLLALEFGIVEIRQALVGLNRIRVKELAKIDGVSAVTIYNTIKGRRTSPKTQELIAQSLNLSVDDLFPMEIGCQPARPQPPTGDNNGQPSE